MSVQNYRTPGGGDIYARWDMGEVTMWVESKNTPVPTWRKIAPVKSAILEELFRAGKLEHIPLPRRRF